MPLERKCNPDPQAACVVQAVTDQANSSQRLAQGYWFGLRLYLLKVKVSVRVSVRVMVRVIGSVAVIIKVCVYVICMV